METDPVSKPLCSPLFSVPFPIHRSRLTLLPMLYGRVEFEINSCVKLIQICGITEYLNMHKHTFKRVYLYTGLSAYIHRPTCMYIGRRQA
jgi:hypothetical protein